MKSLKIAICLLFVLNFGISLKLYGSDCQSYFKIADNACADSCLPSTVGICPRSIIVSTGGLSEGTCATQGFTVSAGSVSQSAGPCGTLTFNKYSKAATIQTLLKTGDCQSYFKIADNACADSCLPSTVGICPRSIIVSTGGLSEGTCTTQGFTVSAGSVSQSAGPCGTLTFNKYNKPAVYKLLKLQDSCQNYTKVVNGVCQQVCLVNQTYGSCSLDQVLSSEGLQLKGSCIDQQFRVLDGTQNATLSCGATIQYTNFIERCLTDKSTACVTYYKFTQDGCSQVCLDGAVGSCSQDQILSLEGLKQGTCSDQGFKVLVKGNTQSLSCGASIDYTNFISRCLKAQQ